MEFLFSKGLENAPLARDIRRKVFVLEQGFSEDLEFDSIDSKAWHVVMTSDGKPVGTGRLFIRSPRHPAIFTIGRLSVLPEYRKTGAGRLILEYLEQEAIRLGAKKLVLCAQVRAEGFYKKCGYSRMLRPLTDDEGVPHVYMKKNIRFPASPQKKRRIAIRSVAVLIALCLCVYGIGGEMIYRDLLVSQSLPASAEAEASWEFSFGWEMLPAENGNFLYARRVINEKSDNRWIVLLHPYQSSSYTITEYAKHFYEMGYNLLLPDLRGHGRSSWAPASMGILDGKDVAAWCEKLSSDYPGCSIGIFGLSMGGSTALTASGQSLPENVKAIAEDSGYVSPWDALSTKLQKDFGLSSFPFLNAADNLCSIYNGYSMASSSSLDAVIHSSIPTLFIHGSEDSLVPLHDMERLFASANCPKQKLVIEGAGHAQCAYTDPDLYWYEMEKFFSTHMDEALSGDPIETGS